MNETTETLRDALQRAADGLQAHAPPRDVPAAVWAALPPPRDACDPRPHRWGWAGGGLALATLGVAAVLVAGAPSPVQRPVATPFLPVVSVERGSHDRWSQLVHDTREHGPAWIVIAELPRESLAGMGLPYDPARAGEPVRAELLVHPGGDVLAVRFVR